jgi:integrase
MKRGHVEANPWTEQGVSKRKRSESNGDSKRRAFTEKEGRDFLASLTSAKGRTAAVDRDVSMVAAVTGMRLEEITSLAPADVERKGNAVWLSVAKGKTDAARRRVPVTAAPVRETLLERKKAGKERLFHELEADRFGDFGSALSKRVGRKLRSIGLTDPALVADHSWRHRARTLMEHAGVTPWVADAVLGHARPGEGLSRYSAGPSEEQRIEAVKAITLPS